MRVERVRAFLRDELWLENPSFSSPLGWLRGFLQFSAMLREGLARHRILLWASSLTYVALLSLIPFLAMALGIAEALGFGVADRITQLLVQQLSAGSPQAVERILALVSGVHFGGLGSVGAALLLITTVLAIGNVERALNEIWGAAYQRPWIRRFPDYLAVLVVTPLFLGVALVLATTLESQTIVRRLFELPGFAQLYALGLAHAPTVLLMFGFSFLYWFLPNTRVHVGAALLGAVVAAALMRVAQSLYVGSSIGMARSNAVFGGLAALPLLLVWIYISNGIMLLGAEIAYAYQNLKLYRREMRGRNPEAADREAVALHCAVLVARCFRDAGTPYTEDTLAEVLDVSPRSVRSVLLELKAAGILTVRGDERCGELQLGRPAERISIAEILHVLRGGREVSIAEGSAVSGSVEAVLVEAKRALAEALRSRTLADLA